MELDMDADGPLPFGVAERCELVRIFSVAKGDTFAAPFCLGVTSTVSFRVGCCSSRSVCGSCVSCTLENRGSLEGWNIGGGGGGICGLSGLGIRGVGA